MCAIIDVVGVGRDRMAWVLWMGGSTEISPILAEVCPLAILDAWQRSQVIDLTGDEYCIKEEKLYSTSLSLSISM
jgi:hypothetical protein